MAVFAVVVACPMLLEPKLLAPHIIPKSVWKDRHDPASNFGAEYYPYTYQKF